MVTTVLGLVGILAFIVSVIALAAGVTWLVVRLTPGSDKKKAESAAGS